MLYTLTVMAKSRTNCSALAARYDDETFCDDFNARTLVLINRNNNIGTKYIALCILYTNGFRFAFKILPPFNNTRIQQYEIVVRYIFVLY